MKLRRRVWVCALLFSVAAAIPAQQPPPYPTRAVELSHVIGDDPSSGATIGTIRNMTVARNGLLYVIDGADFDVKVFEPTGKFVRKFGREGGGPGELRRPLGITVNDTSVMVRDQLNGTVLFALNGTHIATKGPATPFDTGTPLRYGVRFAVELPSIRPSAADMASGKPPSTDPTYRRLLLHRPSGAVDTLASIRTDFVVFTAGSGRGSLRPSGFGDAGTYAVLGDSVIAVVDGYAGVAKWYAITPSGPVLRRTESLRRTGAKITDRDVRDQELRLLAATGFIVASSDGRGGRIPPPSTATISNPPPAWSVATTAMFSDDGALWVGAPRRVTNVQTRPTTSSIANNVWTVFPVNGSPFTIELSSSAPLNAVHGGNIYSIPAFQGEPTIHVYRLKR